MQIQSKSIFHQCQQIIADQLNADEVFTAAKVVFIAENSKGIDFEVTKALKQQGIVGVIMTPTASYIGITHRGELAYDLKDLTIQIVENVPVNRGLPDSMTALDAAQRAHELLSSPLNTLFGVMNPTTIEQGEDSGLIVCQAKFNCTVYARRFNPTTNYAVFADGSEIEGWENTWSSREQFNNFCTEHDKDPYTLVEAYVYQDYIPSDVFVNLNQLKKVVFGQMVDNIDADAFGQNDQLTEVLFKGKTLVQVQALANFPFGIADPSIIKAELG